jgi:glutamate-1-semialdehyde 2,1-aminomutase
MRLARAFTRRDKVMKFEGAYHGNHDYALVSTFPPSPGHGYPRGVADTAGQPAAVRDAMLVAPYNDLEAATRIAEDNADGLAAVIVEPVQRIIPGDEGFLRGLRALCDRLGALLVFDEVVTGFRVAYGGAHAALGIKPDLASFGKVVGAGGPAAVVAGRAEVLDLADPARRGSPDCVYFNGTLHGNPVAAAGTLALLDEVAKPGFCEGLDAATASFCAQAKAVLDRRGVPAIAAHASSLWQFLFVGKPPRSQADIAAGDSAAMRRLDSELMKRGQYLLPGVRRFVSAAHGRSEFDETLEALDEACAIL